MTRRHFPIRTARHRVLRCRKLGFADAEIGLRALETEPGITLLYRLPIFPARAELPLTSPDRAVRNGRRPAIPYPVAQHRHRRRPRVLFGAALVARLRKRDK